MRATFNVRPRARHLRAALRGLTAVNRLILREQPLPALYDSGVRYRPEALGREEWWRADEVWRHKYGDCEDLACWRAAELQNAGEIGAYADVVKLRPRRYHAVVRRERGDIEDPSRILRR